MLEEVLQAFELSACPMSDYMYFQCMTKFSRTIYFQWELMIFCSSVTSVPK